MRALGTLMNPHELAITSMHQIGGDGGNRPSWPVFALVSAKPFAGMPHAA